MLKLQGNVTKSFLTFQCSGTMGGLVIKGLMFTTAKTKLVLNGDLNETVHSLFCKILVIMKKSTMGK